MSILVGTNDELIQRLAVNFAIDEPGAIAQTRYLIVERVRSSSGLSIEAEKAIDKMIRCLGQMDEVDFRNIRKCDKTRRINKLLTEFNALKAQLLEMMSPQGALCTV